MIKQHDWFAASLFQPDLSTEDFYNIGITPDNAEIKAQDAYKNIPEVIEAFSKDGKFDDNAFDTFYNNALSSYNKYAHSEFDKKVLENYEWDPNDWMSPIGAKTKDVSAKFVLGKNNPTKIQSGIEALGIKSESEFSNRELAQANEVRDANGNKMGYTPNEKGGIFKSLSRPTLVLAQYDEDTEEIIDGHKIIHKKGELKLDEWGIPYYEELGDREVYGRDVLHYTDTFTEDGSKWNKYDFFDSDGLDKSIGGTVVKTAFKIAPYFIPYVNYAWGAVNASMEIAQLLPTLGKAVNGFITNNNDSKFGTGLTKWESYLDRFESSVSDYSRDKMVSTENFGNLVSDISGQLWQQRVIGSIPKLLEKTKLLEKGSKNIELGKNMALAYMAGTSAKEVYGSFKEAGATDRTAGLAMIGNIIALNSLMQNDYFKSAIFRGGWLDEDSIKRPAWGVAKQFKEALSEVNEDVLTETGKKKFLSKVSDAFKHSIIPGLQKSEFVRASVAEGVEETMEEAVADISKAFTEGLNAIGLKVTDPNKNLQFNWSLEDIAARYGMSFVGGTIGGALFQANHAWETRNVPKWIKDADNSDLSKLTYLVAQGRGQEIKDYYKKLKNQGLLGDPNLSGSKLRTTVNIKGVDETIAESAEQGQSQNDLVYDALLRQIDYIENVLQDERFAYPEETLQAMALMGIAPKDQEESHLLKAQILNLSLINSGFFNEFNLLATRTVKVRSELETILNEQAQGETDSEKKANADKLKNNEKVKELTEELKKIRKRRDEILEGKHNWYFAGQGLFVLDDASNRGFLSVTKDKFAQLMYNKTISDLTDYEKEKLDEDWQNYQNTQGKQNAYRAYDIYVKLSELSKEILEATIPTLQKSTNDTIHGEKTNLDKYVEKNKEAVEVWKEIETLQKKEDKTDEEVEKLNELVVKFNGLDAEVKGMMSNTSNLLRGDVGEEPSNFAQLNVDRSSLSIAKGFIVSLYKDFASKKQVMRSEDELQAFYNLVKSNPLNAESIKRRLDAYMTAWLEDPELADPTNPDPSETVNKDPLNKLFTMAEDDGNPLQLKLANILQDLELALGSNSDLAKEKFEEAIAFIMEHTHFSRQQTEKIIKSIIAKVGDESLIDVVDEIEQLRSNVTFSPIYDILRQFKAGYSDGTLDIAGLLNGEINRLIGSGNMSEYIISSKQVIAELKEAGNILNVIKSLINGSVSGLNKAVNVLRSKQGLSPIPELDEHTAKILMNDIDFILKRINSLLNIASWNDNKKLKAHKESEIKLKPLTLKCLIDPEFANGFKKLDVDVEDIWRQANAKYNLDLQFITDSNWKEFEETRILFESLLRKAILEKNNGDISGKLIEAFGPSLYKMQTTKIDPETTTISAYDLLWYVSDIITLDSNSFYPRYNNILSKYRTPDGKELAPVYGQELAIRRNISMALNPDLYNNLLEKIYQMYPETMHKKDILPNVSVVLGGAGTGKTVAIAGISAEMLSFDDDVEFVYLAPSKKQADNLASNVQKSGTILTIDSLDEFFEEKPTFEYELDEKGNKTGVIKWKYKLNSKQLWTGGKKRKILIVDEVTLFNSAQIQALSELALNEGGLIWALGDSKQNQSVVKMSDNAMQHTGLEDFTVVKSPELTTALRPSTVGKFDNALLLDSNLSEINRQAVDQDAVTIQTYNTITNSVVDKIEFKYFENDETGELFGERIIEGTDNQVNEYLTRLSKLGTVAYITDKSVALPDGVEKIDASKAQGGEWDYVVIDKKWATDSKYDTLRDLYTLTQRSTKGTVIVNNGLKSVLPVSSKQDVTAAEPMSLNPTDLQEFINWKKNSLGGYVMDMDFIDDFNNAYVEPDDKDDKDDEDDDPTPTDPDPEPEPEGIVSIVSVTPPLSPSGSTPKVGSSSNSMANPEEQRSAGNPLPIDTGENPGENPDVLPTPPPISGPPQNRPNDEPKPQRVRPSNISMTNEISYFDMLFGNDVDLSKSFNIELLQNFGFNADEIKQIVFLLSAAIKANVDPKVVKFRGIGNLLSVQKLERFIKNGRLELNVIPNAKNSTMVASFIKDGSSERFDIPICFLPKGLSGKYVGKFNLEDKPKKKRGVFLPLEEIKRRHPWLHIFDSWQVISFTGNLNRFNFNNKTKRYLSKNIGKVFTLATDNPFLARTANPQTIYSLEPSYDGTDYTHQNVDNFVNFGIIKPVSISEVLQYSFLWSDKIGLFKKEHGNDLPPIVIEGDLDQWIRDMVGLDEIPDKNFGNRRYQILSEDNCSRFLSRMMNLAMSGEFKQISDLIGWSLVDSLHVETKPKLNKDGSKVSYKNGLHFKSGDDWFRMEFDFNSGSYNIFKYYPESETVDTTPVKIMSLESGRFPFKQLQEFVGQIDEFSIATRVFDENNIQIGSPYEQCVSNQISLMFRHITDTNVYDQLDQLLANDKLFLEGRIYTNVAGASGNNPFLPNGVARRFVGKQTGYMSDASEWTPSEYSIDINSLIRGNENIDKQIEFEERIEEISNLVSGIINIDDILSTTSSVQTDYDAKLESIISEVNARLKANSTNWEYKQLRLDGYDYKLETITDLNGWLQEKSGVQGDVNIDFNALETFKFGVFSVSLSNKCYIKHDGTQWVVYEMKSYDSFKPMIEFWNQNKTELVKSVPNFEKYLSEIYSGSTNVSREVAKQLMSSDPIVVSLRTMLMSYLESRIKNEEC